MKKRIIISLSSLFLLGAFSTVSVAADAEKMTYEKAMQSHKATYGKYSEQSITEQQSQTTWDSYRQKPDENSSGGSTEKYTVLYKGICTVGSTCTLTENINNFATVIVGADNRHERLNTAVFPTSGLIGRELNMSINTSGDSNDLIHLKFPSRTTLLYVAARFPGVITDVWGIDKQNPEPTECTTGQIQNESTHCASPLKTCETGTQQKSCSSGFWSPTATISSPICVAQNRQCP